MCTSLTYTDANGDSYVGRTIELDVSEPYYIVHVPAGQQFTSAAEGYQPVSYSGSHAITGIAAPAEMPAPGRSFEPSILKANDAINDAGLTYSLLAYPTTPGPTPAFDRPPIDASDLGTWILSQFSTVEEVKAALADQPVFLPHMAMVGGVLFPFHAHITDRSGSALVIEWDNGEMHLFDNPVGVMTNGPAFPWHLTNLGNWTHLSNVDHSSATLGSLTVNQPDSGIATASLPGSNTAVGRFVRAAYYSKYAEKAKDADDAMLALAHIMDNFDRPRGITVDLPESGGAGISFQGSSIGSGPDTEFTAVTLLMDKSRTQLMVRAYEAFNFLKIDLPALLGADGVRMLPLSGMDPLGGNITSSLLTAKVG